MIYGTLLVAVYCVIAVVMLIKSWKSLKPDMRITLVLGVIVFPISQFTEHYIHKPKEPDEIALLIPYLQADLVFSKDSQSKFTVAYTISNIGNLPADNIRFSFVGPGVRQSEFMTPMKQSIPAKGRMRWVAAPLPFAAPESYDNFLLIASYTTEIDGAAKQYHSVFRHLISKADMEKLSPIPQDSMNFQEGQYFDKETLGVLSQLLSGKNTP